jgi:hypothetical protein
MPLEYMLHNDTPVNKIILSKDIRSHPLLKSWVSKRAMGVENNLINWEALQAHSFRAV